MSATNLKGEALAAHAAACTAAEAELVRLQAVEEQLSGTIHHPHPNPRAFLYEVFSSAMHALKVRLHLPPHSWRATEVTDVIRRICTDPHLAWNGHPLQLGEMATPLLSLQPSLDGQGLLVRCGAVSPHSLIPAQVLGLLIWHATQVVLRRTIMAEYHLSAAQVQCLSQGNVRAHALFRQIMTLVAQHNYAAWWSAHEPIVPRTCEPLHELRAGAVTPYGVYPSVPFTDLPLYCPTGPRAGERIDPVFQVGDSVDARLFRSIVRELRGSLTPDALQTLYELPPSAPSSPP